MIKNKYDLAIHNLRMANTIYESNEQLYEENKRDLDVLEELVKEHELLKGKLKSAEENEMSALKAHESVCYDLTELKEGLQDIQKEDKYWLGTLYKENKILKDGVKVLEYGNDWDFIEYDDYTLVSFNNIYFKFTKEEANKLKAMLEVVKNVR